MLRRPAPAEVSPRVLALLTPEPGGASGWLPEPPPQDPGPVGETSPATWLDGLAPRVEPVDAVAGRAGRHRSPRCTRGSGPGLLTAPVSVRAARYHVSWRAVLALASVLLVALLVFTVRVARAEQTSAPSPVRGSTPAGLVGRSMPSAFATGAPATATQTGAAASSGGPGAGAGGAAPRPAVVHVVGQVARPGVVAVAPGGRVVDALGSAGGPLPGADLQRVNLARVVADGEQIFVPRPGEEIPLAAARAATGGSPEAGGAVAPVLDLNTADLAALDSLPGVGPVLGQRILDWRSEHGRFNAVDELGEVSGIGQKLLDQIRARVRV